MGIRRLAMCAVAAALTAACADSVVVDTGEKPPPNETPLSTSPAGRSDPVLVDAYDYYVTADGLKGYYFTTPSGKWNCAILPRSKAGCQAASGPLGIPGEPDTVASGDGEPGFTWLARPGFSVKSGKPLVLDFNKTLAAAGFRCNVREAGVSCLNEGTKKGFTFSPSGFVARYTAVLG